MWNITSKEIGSCKQGKWECRRALSLRGRDFVPKHYCCLLSTDNKDKTNKTPVHLHFPVTQLLKKELDYKSLMFLHIQEPCICQTAVIGLIEEFL